MKTSSIDFEITETEYIELCDIKLCPCPFCFENNLTLENILWCFGENYKGDDWYDVVSLMCPRCYSQGPTQKSKYLALMGWNAEDMGPNDYL